MFLVFLMLQVSVASTVACPSESEPDPPSMFLHPVSCMCLPTSLVRPCCSPSSAQCIKSYNAYEYSPYIPTHTSFSPFSLTADPGANKLRAGHAERSKRTAPIGNDGEGRAEEEHYCKRGQLPGLLISLIGLESGGKCRLT